MQSDLSLNIRKRREELGLSQMAVAEKLGITRAAVSLWESGNRNMSIGSLEALAAVLQTTLFELVGATQTRIDSDLLARALESLDAALSVSGTQLTHTQRAKILAFIYGKASEVPHKDVVELCRMMT